MGDGLDVSGGAGGMAADLADLRSQAGAMRGAGDDLLERVGRVSGGAVDGDVLTAALVCPDLVPGVEAAVLWAATGPNGLTVRGGALLVSGTLIDASVTTYEFVDDTAKKTFDALQAATGFAAGVVLPGAVVLGGVGLLALSVQNPALAIALAREVQSGELTDDVMQTIYDNPWLMEALTRGAPGLVQGTGFTLSTLLGPGGLALLSGLTGGRWPSLDYETSIAGLIALGNLGGAFVDDGSFTIDGDPSSTVTLGDGWSLDHAVQDVFTQQGLMDDGQSTEESAESGQLRVIKVPQADGSFAYVVQVPGTEDWSPTRTGNPVDLTSNVTLMTGGDSVWRQTVIDAIREQVPPGSPVMLTGHSQGGITAASIASDPAVVRELNIQSVVTGGSPIGRFDIDPSVSVLSVEHEQDPVPMLDGTSNPDAPNWTTVRRDLPDELAGGSADSPPNPGNAHATKNYVTTGAMIDGSDDPSIEAWREQNAKFFTGSGPVEASRYDVVRH
ncbi:hypothetical protein [Oryzobacter telluris]|uniref:hypothetical protein n=1 Tax=Oryzobacter telluris TaxID=3149179 RepID=UPI00370D053C